MPTDSTRPLPRIVVASRNRDKVAAVARASAGSAAVESPPNDISLETCEPEDALSLMANAHTKAALWSRALPGELVVASDGGLLIPALGAAWEPARTRRFAGEQATNHDRANALLGLTSALKGDERRIGWREALAVARDGTVLAAWEAEGAPGLLAQDYDPACLGAHGFWVPAVWLCPEFGGRRLATLSEAECARRDDHWSRLGLELRLALTKWSTAP